MLPEPLTTYYRTLGLWGVAVSVWGRLSGRPRLLRVRWPEPGRSLYLRAPSADVRTLEQIRVRRDYEFPVSRPPAVIVDAGANIGLASLYFAHRYPTARIIAIEPEANNFALLVRNTRAYPNISAVRGALWSDDRPLDLVDPGIGNWGFRTSPAPAGQSRQDARETKVRGMTIDSLMRDQGITHIDILKLDIEGAEWEVFADPSRWLHAVDAIIIELHEGIRPGCTDRFRDRTRLFNSEWMQGENVYRVRRGGCLSHSAS